MKTTIERGALLRALGHAQSIVERRNTIPILSNILLDASDDSLTVMATDLDIETREPVQARVDRAGRITVPGHTLFDIVRKMPPGDITLESAEGRMSVVAGRARFSVPTLPAEDFPIIAVGALPTSFTVPIDVLADMLGATRFAMSTEETRYYLNGILLHVRQGADGEPRLGAASTDGHRLALATTAIPEGVSPDVRGVIVPRKCVAELAKVIDENDGDVVVSFSNTKIRFEFGRLTYVSKLIDGTFPDYDRVIPRANQAVVRASADLLQESIDRVSTIATERTRAVKLALERNLIVLSVTSPENGVANEEVEVEYDGPSFEVGFNSRYFLDILQLLKGQEIELVMQDAAAPVIVRRVGESDDLAVLMPMRV